MQSLLAKEARRIFAAHIKESLPQFKLSRHAVVPAGSRVFERVLDGLSLFIFLGFAPNEDRILVEVGWSEYGTWPDSDYTWGPDDPPVRGGARFRIQALWGEKNSDSYGRIGPPTGMNWETGQFVPTHSAKELLSEVEPTIGEIMGKVRTVAMPYFERIAQQHGLALASKA